jgi:Nucleotide-diphospho-sugar transferase
MSESRASNRGAIYCATGSVNYLEAALISAIAFRRLNPDIPVTLVSDCQLNHALLHEHGITPIAIEADPNRFASRHIKTGLGRLSPYTETLYLDADILPLKPIASIWDYLEQADLGMVRDRTPTIGQCNHIGTKERRHTLRTLPASTPQYNGGLLLWRKSSATQDLFAEWRQEWERFRKQDQLALVRALARSPVTIAPLPGHYNISPFDAARCAMPAYKITGLHCWGGQVESGRFRQVAARYYPDIVAAVTGVR